jgi:addiction module HigA family antidote
MVRSAIHPGEVLRNELEELGVMSTELARQIAVPPNRISQIIGGRRAITGDAYDLRVAAQASGRRIAKLPTRHAA